LRLALRRYAPLILLAGGRSEIKKENGRNEWISFKLNIYRLFARVVPDRKFINYPTKSTAYPI
jgi:hypothetical protein